MRRIIWGVVRTILSLSTHLITRSSHLLRSNNTGSSSGNQQSALNARRAEGEKEGDFSAPGRPDPEIPLPLRILCSRPLTSLPSQEELLRGELSPKPRRGGSRRSFVVILSERGGGGGASSASSPNERSSPPESGLVRSSCCRAPTQRCRSAAIIKRRAAPSQTEQPGSSSVRATPAAPPCRLRRGAPLFRSGTHNTHPRPY